MSRVFIFSDEAGDFSFKRDGRASKYFMVCSIKMDNCDIGSKLIYLRRDMVWRGVDVKEEFHATNDRNDVRNEVFDFIERQKFRIDATILEKSKAQPQTRTTEDQFYKYAWYYHFKYVGQDYAKECTELMITAAALGTKRGKAAYTSAVNDVIQQTTKGKVWKTFFPRAVADPCLQIADYCAWAIQRKWERSDTRWYDRIKPKIATEFDLWSGGSNHHY